LADKLWIYSYCQKYRYELIVLLFLSFLFSGCASLPDPETAQVNYSNPIVSLGKEPGQASSVAQEILPRHNRMNSIMLWLSGPVQAASQEAPTFTFQLFSEQSPGDKPLYQASFRLIHPDFNGPFRITFPPQTDSAGKKFFIRLSPVNGTLLVWGKPGEAYVGGRTLIDNRWEQGDIAFSITYQYHVFVLKEDLERLFSTIWVAFPAVILLLMPGLLIFDLISAWIRYHFWERLAISAGLSLAISPLIILWSNTVGIRWSRSTAIGIAVFLTAIVVLRFLWKKPWRREMHIQSSDIALFGILLLSLFVRAIIVRDLTVPPWVDSVHHAYITRQIQEQGGVLISYEPDFQIHPTAYHPGFHATFALFQWITNLDIPTAMLIFGQILNWIAVLSAYLFAKAIVKNQWAGTCAALAAGLLMPLPAYLTSWGRYTHLAGMIIFAALVALSESLLSNHAKATDKANLQKSTQTTWRRQILLLIVCSIGLSGLSLVHYRVVAFLGIWWLSVIICSLTDTKAFFWKVRSLFAIGLLSLVLNAPWILSTIRNTFLPNIGFEEQNLADLFQGFDPSLIMAASGPFVLFAATIGFILLAIKQPRIILTMCVWIVLMFFMANLSALGMPGGKFVNNLSVEITLFLPISLAAGYAPARISQISTDLLNRHWTNILRIPVITGLVATSLIGFNRLLPILNPTTVLAHQSDINAIQWIENYILKEEAFLINPHNWGYGLCTGADGGYWIMPLAGNLTYPPPILYGFGSQHSIVKITDLCDLTRRNADKPEELHSLMRQTQIKYIYIGSKGGVLSPQTFKNHRLFRERYAKDGVWIFEIVP
jgi:hypothetical protein